VAESTGRHAGSWRVQRAMRDSRPGRLEKPWARSGAMLFAVMVNRKHGAAGRRHPDRQVLGAPSGGLPGYGVQRSRHIALLGRRSRTESSLIGAIVETYRRSAITGWAFYPYWQEEGALRFLSCRAGERAAIAAVSAFARALAQDEAGARLGCGRRIQRVIERTSAVAGRIVSALMLSHAGGLCPGPRRGPPSMFLGYAPCRGGGGPREPLPGARPPGQPRRGIWAPCARTVRGRRARGVMSSVADSCTSPARML